MRKTSLFGKDSLSIKKVKKRFARLTTIPKPASNNVNGSDDDIKIFSVFGKHNLVDSLNENIHMSTLNVPIGEQPCSSKHGIDNVGKTLCSDNDELQDRNTWVYLRHDMLADMLSNVRKETVYITCLKRFIGFEEAVKKGDNSWTVFRKVKRKKGKRSKNVVKGFVASNETNIPTELHHDLEQEESSGIASQDFVGDIQDRMHMREKTLNVLLKHYNNDEDMYDEAFEMFVNMEENWVA